MSTDTTTAATERAAAATTDRARGPGRLLTAIFVLAIFNTGYLSWRFVALAAGWVEPGTGLCSWTEGIDCDKVLVTPQARAYYFPNALLGLGFWVGCLVWWEWGRRLGAAYRRHVLRTLAFWLAVAALLTFRFFWLLLHLEAFCPLCPWNHLLTYAALALACVLWRHAPPRAHDAPHAPLARLVAVCVAQFWAWQLAWLLAHRAGRL
jgi:uncharacterized membrane protein